MRKVPIRALLLLALLVCLGYPAAATTVLFNSSNSATYGTTGSPNFTEYVNAGNMTQSAATSDFLNFNENGSNASVVTLYSAAGNVGSIQSLYVDFQIVDAHGGSHGSSVGVAFLTSTSAGTITNGFAVIAGNGVDAGNGNSYIGFYSIGASGLNLGSSKIDTLVIGDAGGTGMSDGTSAPWYRLVVFYQASGTTVSGTAQVYNLGTSPSNLPISQVGGTFNFTTNSTITDGQVGIAGAASSNPNANDNIEEFRFDVPEPGTWVTLGGGLLGLLAMRRRFRK